ncbi:MAG: helix-turn-helix transcriptional regulator [Polyangiaceae bacterium]
MTPCATPEEFERSPAGRYYVGRCFVFWQQSPELDGHSIWGAPDVESIRLIVRFLDTGLVSPHASLLDMRAVTGVDYASFDAMYRGVRDRQDGFAKTISRQAILRPSGPVGAIILGFYNLIQVRYPVQHFTDQGDALEWMGIAKRGDVLAELADMRESAFGRPELIARLLAQLTCTTGRGSPDMIAKALGLSVRSMQRKLADLGTSFRDEVHAFRVERAKKLLLETDGSLLVVADSVGFESVRTFTEVFGKRTGESPQSFRMRERKSPGWPRNHLKEDP